MKPPANALSNLPLVAAGGYDVGEVESRQSDPMVMTPRHTEVPHLPPPARKPPSGPAPRSTHTPKPFAPALAPRRADGHPGVVAAVLLLALAGGAGAGWYFFLRPGTGGASTNPDASPPSSATTPAPPADTTWLAFDRSADTVAVALLAAAVPDGRDESARLHRAVRRVGPGRGRVDRVQHRQEAGAAARRATRHP
jgi:hypothetical protein